jgi:hypothetical protein
MAYTPLTAEEQEKMKEELLKFYDQLKLLNAEKEEYQNSILNLRYQRAKKGHSFLTIAKLVSENKKEIKSIDVLIETLRPATPQGELVCHSCDVKGMALLEKNYKNSDSDLYKCQVCDAKYIKDNLSTF